MLITITTLIVQRNNKDDSNHGKAGETGRGRPGLQQDVVRAAVPGARERLLYHYIIVYDRSLDYVAVNV